MVLDGAVTQRPLLVWSQLITLIAGRNQLTSLDAAVLCSFTVSFFQSSAVLLIESRPSF
jgi:hypothetical protein